MTNRPKVQAFVSVLALCAFTLIATFSPVSAENARTRPALWKIHGVTGDVYLFGSFHILPEGLDWRHSELERALQSAQRLEFEIDLDESQNVAVMGGLVQRYGLLPPGQSLFKILAPEYRKKLDDTVTSLGLAPASIDRMRPWLVALTITSLSIVKQNTKPGDEIDPSAATTDQGGVDIQLWNWAKANNKERGALETTENQIRVFADLNRDQEIQYLIMTLVQTAEMSKSIEDLLTAWKNGDTQTLDKSLNGEMDSFQAMRKALFQDRHEKWLPQIEAMLHDGKTHVVIVGAAHLVGKGSVIDLLRAKGLKVEGP